MLDLILLLLAYEVLRLRSEVTIATNRTGLILIQLIIVFSDSLWFLMHRDLEISDLCFSRDERSIYSSANFPIRDGGC